MFFMHNAKISTSRKPSRIIEYTEITTIHGLKYLGVKDRPIADKIFWIVIFAISFVALGVFVDDVLKKWIQYSAILVEDDQSTPIHSIPFPAVTICPAVKIKNEYLSILKEGEINNSAQYRNLLDLVPLIYNQNFYSATRRNISNTSEHLNLSHIELLHDISPNVSDIFNNVRFESKPELFYEVRNQKYYLKTPFSSILTNEGRCFTFNVPSEIIKDEPQLQTEYKYHNIENESTSWYSDMGYYGYPNYPRAVWGSGSDNGLHLRLQSAKDDLHTICQPTKIGYKLILHSPVEYPSTFEKFISIPHNTMTQIKVTPKITTTSVELMDYNPLQRRCYFIDEKPLQYYQYYNRVNCKLDCLARYTKKQYGCVHFSQPRSQIVPICGASVNIHKMYDTEENIKSYFEYQAKVKNEFYTTLDGDEPINFRNFTNFHCNCLPACISVEYEYVTETVDIAVNEIWAEKLSNISIDGAVALIDIYFTTTKVRGVTRKQFYTLSDLVSNIGGLVGLFMGASILSVFEIIYFFIVRDDRVPAK